MASKRFTFCVLTALASAALAGCGIRDSHPRVFKHHAQKSEGIVRDSVPVCDNPLLQAAQCVTRLEDELRNEGTISVKAPDVWGDSNLMHSIQEFDEEMDKTIGAFTETLQGISADSDVAKSQRDLQALFSTPESTATLPTTTSLTFGDRTSLATLLSSTKAEKLSIEPTASELQHATYVYLNQRLRRRNMAGDNTRKAGYGLYMFRIPISVIPGEDTSQGYSAVANFRAQLKVTAADVKYTLPRMAIADLVDALAERVKKEWKSKTLAERKQEFLKSYQDTLKVLQEKVPNFAANSPLTIVAYLNANLSTIPNVEFERLLNEIKLIVDEDPAIEVARQLERDKEKQRTQLIAAARTQDLSAFSTTKATLRDMVPMGQTCCIDNIDTSTNEAIKKSMADILSGEESIDRDEELYRALSPEGFRINDSFKLMIAGGSPVNELVTIDKPQVRQPEVKSTGIPQLAAGDFKPEDFLAVRDVLKMNNYTLGDNPTVHEVRNALFEMLEQVNIRIQRRNGYSIASPEGHYAINVAAESIERGAEIAHIEDFWKAQFTASNPGESYVFQKTAWLLAKQCGIVDLNIKRMVEELQLKGDMQPHETDTIHGINFFADQDLMEATRLWQAIVHANFPLHVFTLEPQIDEQNLLDSSSRLREMQFALAYSVAQTGWNVTQKVALARQLANDTAVIDVNRTAVGFMHGDDTFGWYFHPRAQAVNLPQTNRAAFRQLRRNPAASPEQIRSNSRLEPGIRECEVLIAMPSFVSGVNFDVTTNWESLAEPGRSLNSYEELISQGASLQQARECLNSSDCAYEYREGDIRRLHSRVDQLENMLSMQTVSVEVPYEYDQSANEMFDQGDRQLIPKVNGSYGLTYLVAEDGKDLTADFFVTGKNFHPTNTHVVVGGHESHSVGDSNSVEILSRELMRVRTTVKTDKFAGDNFEVRVGTPGGMSNPIFIAKTPKKEEPKAASDFNWSTQPKLTAFFTDDPGDVNRVTAYVYSDLPESTKVEISPSSDNPFGWNNFDGETLAQIVTVYEAEFKNETKTKFTGTPYPFTPAFNKNDLVASVKADLSAKLRRTTPKEGTIKGTTYLRLDEWSYVKFGTQMEIQLKPQSKDPTCEVTKAPAAAAPIPVPGVIESGNN
jgi:hypothetical protein